MQESEVFLQQARRGQYGSSYLAPHYHRHHRLHTFMRPEGQHDRACVGHYLDVPAATVGGLMAGTYKPCCSSWADALSAAASLPTIMGTIGDSAGIPKPSASRSTSLHKCFRLSGSYVHARHWSSATSNFNTGNCYQLTVTLRCAKAMTICQSHAAWMGPRCTDVRPESAA